MITNATIKVQPEIKIELFDFQPISKDYIFKTLWMNGSVDTRNFFYRVIKRIVGYDVSNFTFYSNELPINKRNNINHRVDFLLTSPDGKRKVNIELNRKYYKTLMKRNESYLYRIAGNFYDKRKKNTYDKDLLVDIPILSMSCYNKNKEEQLDYKMFEAQSFDEMAQYAKGNKERMSVLRDMYALIKDDEDYSYPGEGDALQESIEHEIRVNARKKGLEEGREEGRKVGIKEGIKEGRKEGIKEGIKEGRKEGHKEGLVEGRKQERTNIIKSLLNSGMSKEEIAKNLEKDKTSMELIKFYEKINAQLPEQKRKDYELYNYFCNNVVAELLKEKYLYC